MAVYQTDLEKDDPKSLNFDDTEIAFRGKSNKDLQQAYWLFRLISSRFLTRTGQGIVNFALKTGLPVTSIIKSTLFRQFCGGETIQDCENVIGQLAQNRVGTILDYSVEGENNERAFTKTADEIVKTIRRAAGDKNIPLTVFKITGIGRFGLLEKQDAGQELSDAEQVEWIRLRARVNMICSTAYEADVRIMIDAEESWIQNTIDKLVMDMMRRYNRDRVIVFNTCQAYRRGKLQSLMDDTAFAKSNGFLLGVKLVRGAYMEKERRRAEQLGYSSPIHPDKESTDRDYNAALQFCMDNPEQIALIAGTHNEQSCFLLSNLIGRKNIPRDHPGIYFAQLLGMGDNLSFNLSDAGYNVAKYVPYGPLRSVLPYLFRRAQENTSVAGQTGRELSLIVREKKRRKNL